MKSVWMKFRSALQSFRRAHAGNVAIIFAFATIPIIAGVGFAVDYSRANQVKIAMQAAIDSTALMISKEAAHDTADQLQTNATNYFNALFTRFNESTATINATYTREGGTQVAITGTANVPTSLLGIVGLDHMTVTSSSTVRWGSSRLRVALVLDNTGSMADSGKIAALKTATANLLTQLQNAASVNGDVYVSIIPFVKDVNLGPGEWNSDWIYWGTTGAGGQDPNATDNTSWDANNGSCSAGSYSSRSSCVSHSTCSLSGYTSQTSCTGAGTCSLSGYSSSSSCTGAGTCSLSSYTTSGTCTAAGTCSQASLTTQTLCSTGKCTLSGYTSQSSCTGAGTCSNPAKTSQSGCTTQKACTNSSYTTQSQCTGHGYAWNYGTWTAGVWTPPGTWTAGTWAAGVWTAGAWSADTWTPALHNTWNGCVMDRGYPASPSYLTVSGSNKSGADAINNFDTNVVQPDPITPKWSSLYAAEQYGSCPHAIMGLSYDWTTMNQLVTNMSPAGNTNQAIGLQLGWLSLVGGGPFTAPPMDSNYTYSQVIILLTDGLNTQNRWSSSQSSIDARERLTCNNINAAGITLYTIQVNTGNDATSTLLQNCAGTAATATAPAVYPDSSKFFLLTSADAIVTTFQSIGTKLSNLYVAR
jgi:Flp pilus assembly protein TadG